MSDTEKPDEKPSETDISEVQNTPEPAIDRRAMLADISLDQALSDQVAIKTPLDEKKKKQIMYGGIGIFVVLIVLALFSCQPAKGSMAYGICSTFLELTTPYPETLQHTDLEGSMTAVRIYFTSLDPFGEFRQEMIECTFGPDDIMGMKLTQVTRNRRIVDPEVVKKFNIALPTIMASEPYVVLPPAWKNPLLPD